MSVSRRWAQPVLFPWWWRGMWGVWTKNQHQGLWCLHAPGVPGSVGIQCYSVPPRPAVPRLGHHWPTSSIPGSHPAVHDISCRHSKSLLCPSRLPITKAVSLDVATWPYLCCGSVAKSCPTLCNPVDYSTPGFPDFHYLPQFAWIHIHWVGDPIQPPTQTRDHSLPAAWAETVRRLISA